MEEMYVLRILSKLQQTPSLLHCGQAPATGRDETVMSLVLQKSECCVSLDKAVTLPHSPCDREAPTSTARRDTIMGSEEKMRHS